MPWRNGVVVTDTAVGPMDPELAAAVVAEDLATATYRISLSVEVAA